MPMPSCLTCFSLNNPAIPYPLRKTPSDYYFVFSDARGVVWLVPPNACFESQKAGVESVWINYTCPGDLAASSTCWTREGVAEYCAKSASGNVGNVLLRWPAPVGRGPLFVDHVYRNRNFETYYWASCWSPGFYDVVDWLIDWRVCCFFCVGIHFSGGFFFGGDGVLSYAWIQTVRFAYGYIWRKACLPSWLHFDF